MLTSSWFRSQGDAALEDWEKDEVDVDEQVLDWALWHILAGLKDKVSFQLYPHDLLGAFGSLTHPPSPSQLGSFTSESLTTSPFPLPIETSFGLPSTSSDPRSGSRSRETSSVYPQTALRGSPSLGSCRTNHYKL